MSRRISSSAIVGFLAGATCSVALTYLVLRQAKRARLAKQKRRKSKTNNGNNVNTDNNNNNNNNKNNYHGTSRSINTSKKENRSTNNSSNTVANIPDAIRKELISRHTLYFGEEGMKSIQEAKICIVGLGGVGSHTAVMLARGGVQHLRLIDFDQVTVSSLNRHACATLQHVGIPKVTCVQRFCQEQLGTLHVETRVEMYTHETGPSLLKIKDNEDSNDNNKDNNTKWDIVIDCIDDVPTKAALIAYCISKKIKIFSCMGAGGKSDMTRLHLSDLRTASRDPLASKLRQTMKRTISKYYKNDPILNSDNSTTTSFLDDMDQLTIIYSSEKVVCKLADFTPEQQEQQNKQQYGAVDGMRIRIIPVLGPMPAIMGQSLAAMTLCELGNLPIHQPVTGERVSKNVRNRLYQHLQRREELIAKQSLKPFFTSPNNENNNHSETTKGSNIYTGPLEIDHDDMEYLMGVWRNRCGVTGARLGTVLELARWDLTQPATTYNLVLMSTHAIKAYDEKGRDSIPIHVQETIEKRLKACKDVNNEFN